jgi:hypothetical protein
LREDNPADFACGNNCSSTEYGICGSHNGRMGLPFDAKRVHEYAVEFGAGGQRLGCKFRLADVSLLFAHESHITPEIEQLMASLTNQRFEAWRIRRWGGEGQNQNSDQLPA